METNELTEAFENFKIAVDQLESDFLWFLSYVEKYKKSDLRHLCDDISTLISSLYDCITDGIEILDPEEEESNG